MIDHHDENDGNPWMRLFGPSSKFKIQDIHEHCKITYDHDQALWQKSWSPAHHHPIIAMIMIIIVFITMPVMIMMIGQLPGQNLWS